jgi:hypothetical protein
MKIAHPWSNIEEEMSDAYVRKDTQGAAAAAIMIENVSGFNCFYWCVFNTLSYSCGESNSLEEAKATADNMLRDLGYRVIDQKYYVLR